MIECPPVSQRFLRSGVGTLAIDLGLPEQLIRRCDDILNFRTGLRLEERPPAKGARICLKS